MSYRNSIPRIIRQLPIASSEPPSILPPSFDPFRNSITAPVQGSSSANRLLRPIAKKRRITEMWALLKLLNWLSVYWKTSSSCKREPPKNSPLRSLPHIFGHLLPDMWMRCQLHVTDQYTVLVVLMFQRGILLEVCSVCLVIQLG